MIISCNWLGKYIELPEDTRQLIRTLTFSGIEVEAVKPLEALPPTVVSARILSAEKIAGSDHLQVCSVDYGAAEPVQVVCGAPNCRSGQIGILATVGTQLKDLAIGKAKLRGVESFGMLCSEKELGISDNHAGIIELPTDTPIGVSVNGLYGLPDTILELEITPNRPDLLGYIGIARDLSASLGKPLTLPEIKPVKGIVGSGMDLRLILEEPQQCPRYTARLLTGVTVKESPLWLKVALIKTGLRPINNIVDVTNYVLMEQGHPLHAFDYGKLLPQPEGEHPAIIVRKARQGEEFLALDNKLYTLDEADLVIADGQRASALAGVMGGLDTAISDATTSIVLEAATFAPGTIRATSYKHKLSSDSSYRFERHLCAETPPTASDRAVELLLEVAGGQVAGELYDAWPNPDQPLYLGLRPCRFEQLISFKLEEEQIKAYLESLGCRFYQYGDWIPGPITDPTSIHCYHKEQEEAGVTEFAEIDCAHALYFRIPPYRVDLIREIDLIEELARLAGFDSVPRKKDIPIVMDRHAHRLSRKIQDFMVHNGFCEVLNYSFCDPAQLAAMGFDAKELERSLINLVNPQSSNQAAMRISLVPQLLANLSYNLNRGERNLRLMEQAKVYLKDGDTCREPLRLTALLTGKSGSDHWRNKPANLDIYHVKGIVEGLLGLLQPGQISTGPYAMPYLVGTDNLAWHSGETLIGGIGRINPQAAEVAGIDLNVLKQDLWLIDLDLDAMISLTRDRQPEFSPLPRFPGVVRDMSFLIEQTASWAEIETAIRKVDKQLIQSVSIFDEYRGKQVPAGFRSLSLHLAIQDSEKTLTDERVDQLIASVLKMLQERWQISLR